MPKTRRVSESSFGSIYFILGMCIARIDRVTLFLCGDVMTGRGVDQILPHPSGHEIFEPYVQDARGYVELAESRNSPIPKPVPGHHPRPIEVYRDRFILYGCGDFINDYRRH